VALAPRRDGVLLAAVERGGGDVVGLDDHPDALVWDAPGDWSQLEPVLATAPSARWVQLPFAGVEGVAHLLTPDRTWSCAKGVYSETVAEHALALALAGLRGLPGYARARSWTEQSGVSLYDAPVVVLGAGGITTALLDLLAPFRCHVTVVRRNASRPVPGAARTAALHDLDAVLADALVVVLALALTPETTSVIGPAQLEAMREDAWLVNVARGAHVDTAALVEALERGSIGGAALDVTEPEPLPDGHPLWSLPTCLITPHTANPWSAARPLLAARIEQNVRRFSVGQELLGLVDVEAGY
jgi:phosphoglycerate dehydrogenase-like enzyme